MIRLFFAVPLSEEVREAVARVQTEIRALAGERGIRWTPPEQFHYTLKFLGETAESDVPKAKEAAQLVAAQTAPFTLTLAGVGAFPNQRRPQIIWLGATEGVPVLMHLAESLDKALSARGFAPETRRFHPHLTLARVKSPEGQQAIAKNGVTEQKRVDKICIHRVDSFVLMRSELKPAGAVHTVLETFPFQQI